MRKPPRKIKVQSHDYTIEVVKDLEVGPDAWGACHRKFLRIQLDKELAPSLMKDVLFHELGHGVYYSSGLTFLVPEKHEEHIVQHMTAGLLQVLRDNPKLREYLFDNE